MIIWVLDRHGAVAQAALSRTIAAINKQIVRDFLPFWGMACTLRQAHGKIRSKGPHAMQSACVLYLQKEIDDGSLLGYHEANNAGIPFSVVSTAVSDELDEPWSATLSHEALELIADPQNNVVVKGPHPGKARYDVFHWFEMCDAVQADMYVIDRVKVSNFVLPFYFTPGRQSGQNDFMDSGVQSFGLKSGGYIGFYDPRTKRTRTLDGGPVAKSRLAIKKQLGMLRRGARRELDSAGLAKLTGRRPAR